MKKVVVVLSLLAVLFLSMCSTGFASELNWRINIKADDGAGTNSTSAQFGVKTGSRDPLPSDVLPLSDNQDNRWYVVMPTLWTVAGVFATDTAGLNKAAWNSDIKSDLMPWDSAYASQDYRKVWDLRAAGAGANTGSTMRLRFMTVGAAVLPPAQLTYSAGPPVVKVDAKYWLKMVNNRGVQGAPANGTIWAIPIPTVYSATTPYFILTLPALNISIQRSEAALIAEGYAMEFYQTGVPEPSSLLALAGGLLALAGCASRRRK